MIRGPVNEYHRLKLRSPRRDWPTTDVQCHLWSERRAPRRGYTQNDKPIDDFTEKSPIQPQRHQDTKFIEDEAQILQSQYAKYLTYA